jgi:uncharacterized protein
MEELTFSVSSLFEKGIGTSEIYSFDSAVEFDDINLQGNVTGKVEVMKTDEGFNVKLIGVEAEAVFNCERCLEKMNVKVHLDSAERIFLLEKPKEIEDPHDIYLVDTKHLRIDIKEMLRQELILHFPANPVCSTSCQGICAYCGKDKNKEECKCSPEESEEYKPLSILKDLFKKK